MKFAILLLLIGLGACTTAERNVLAVGVCERTEGCTVTNYPPDNGPPQVRAMENRKPESRTTRKRS